METQWKSKRLHEHPTPHCKGAYGHVVLSPAGVYGMLQGNVWISCPSDWAAKIQAEEQAATPTD